MRGAPRHAADHLIVSFLSVPHWLAYWAVGWRITATMYANEIRTLFYHIEQAMPRIHPLNRAAVELYLRQTWGPLTVLVLALDPWYDSSLQDRFQDYVDHEKQRIQTNLEKIKYNIDALDTLYLVVGSGRLEKV